MSAESAVNNQFVHHNPLVYASNIKLYKSVFSMPDPSLLVKAEPTEERPVLQPLLYRGVPGNQAELNQMGPWNSDVEAHPVIRISHNLLETFLAYVHSFTAVGLEAQASAYSFGNDGVIKYLAILPQINRIGTVSSAPDEPLPDEIFQSFRDVDKSNSRKEGTFVFSLLDSYTSSLATVHVQLGYWANVYE